MKAKGLYDAGQLASAIEAAIEEVRSRPADRSARTFLFELVCFTGDIDRARKQLDVIGHQDQESEWGAQVYRNILDAEQKRRLCMQGTYQPQYLGDPPDYVATHLAAIKSLNAGDATGSKRLLEQAEEVRPPQRGRRGGQPFDDFRDCDDLLAPCLEFIIVDEYVWIPIEQIQELEVSPPERPRDLIWPAGRILLTDGTQRRGYFCALYPGTHAQSDDQLRLGRKTDWLTHGGGPVTGVGQKLFLLGDDALPLLELGTVELDRS